MPTALNNAPAHVGACLPQGATSIGRRTATLVFHWFSALALLGAAASIIGREWTEDTAWRIALMDMHRQLGLAVLLTWLPRLIARRGHGRRASPSSVPALERWAAHAVHGALYGLLVAMPLLGWALCSAHATHLRLLGLLPLPDLVKPEPDLADRLSDWHAWGAWALLALVVGHVAAALWHHWVKRDDVLASMLPRRSHGSRRSGWLRRPWPRVGPSANTA